MLPSPKPNFLGRSTCWRQYSEWSLVHSGCQAQRTSTQTKKALAHLRNPCSHCGCKSSRSRLLTAMSVISTRSQLLGSNSHGSRAQIEASLCCSRRHIEKLFACEMQKSLCLMQNCYECS